jgi:hypothetical protein
MWCCLVWRCGTKLFLLYSLHQKASPPPSIVWLTEANSRQFDGSLRILVRRRCPGLVGFMQKIMRHAGRLTWVILHVYARIIIAPNYTACGTWSHRCCGTFGFKSVCCSLNWQCGIRFLLECFLNQKASPLPSTVWLTEVDLCLSNGPFVFWFSKGLFICLPGPALDFGPVGTHKTLISCANISSKYIKYPCICLVPQF